MSSQLLVSTTKECGVELHCFVTFRIVRIVSCGTIRFMTCILKYICHVINWLQYNEEVLRGTPLFCDLSLRLHGC